MTTEERVAFKGHLTITRVSEDRFDYDTGRGPMGFAHRLTHPESFKILSGLFKGLQFIEEFSLAVKEDE